MLPRYIQTISALAVLTTLGLSRPGPAGAQDPPSPDAPALPTTQAASGPNTLAQALELVRRSEHERPLLVVDAARTPPAFRPSLRFSTSIIGDTIIQKGHPTPPGDALTPRRDGTFALRDTAAFFGRKIVTAGSVSVLAPATMVVLNTRPGKPDLSASPEAGDRLQMLLASLSPGQWRLLGGERGLGAGDLDLPAQRALFLSLLPDPLRLHRSVVGDGPEGKRPVRPDGDPVTLSPGQRAAVRLVLLRQAVLFVPQPDRPRYFWSFHLDRRRPEGASYLQMESSISDFFRDSHSRAEAYGVTLKEEVASRPKRGDLDFDAARLDPPVALNGVQTVGDLVKRAGAAAGLELHADAHLAVLPVTVLGGGDDENLSVRAGDVLRALSLAVTGAFRKVSSDGETAYVLTDDVEGIGTRQARLEAWRGVAEARVAGQRRALLARIARLRPAGQEPAFAPDDPYALPASLVRKMESAGAKSRLGDLGTAVNVSELPPAFQQIVRAAATGDNSRAGTAYNETEGRTGAGQVGVAVRTTIACVVPGKGIVTGLPGVYGDVDHLLTPYPFGPPSPPASPAQDTPPVNLSGLPPSLAARVLLTRLPASVGEAAALVREAGRRGLNQVWLALPDTQAAAEAQTRAILNAAIAAGRIGAAQKTSVIALTPVLGRREAQGGELGPGEDDLDRNILGETRAQEARRLAATPGPPGAYPDAGDPNVERRRRERLLGMGDLLRVDRPDLTARIARHLSDLAALPGLAGLALEQTAAPGYAMPGSEAEYWGNSPAPGWGYTPSMRLAFLRQTGVDPVDLNVANGRSPNWLDLPFFPGASPLILQIVNGKPVENEDNAKAKKPAVAWLAFRYEANRRFLADLHAALGQSNPGLPLLLAERGGAPWFSGAVEDPLWYSFWERPDALPRFSYAFDGPGGAPPPLAQQARRFSPRNLARLGPWPGRDRFPEWLPKNLPNLAKDWSGFVFDLREMPAADALALLQTAFAPSGDGK